MRVFLVLLCLGCRPTESATPKTPSRGKPTLQWVTPVVHAVRLQHGVFYSASAKSQVSYHIYTPERYDTEKKRRFPVLYWLHGHGGGLKGISYLVKHFDLAIRAGKMPPVLIVFPNGMFESMWCNSKDGRVPMEAVVVKELVPHIDATYRTVASRKGRLIEGFSMGGYGAARLGFKYYNTFGAVSMLGAGPLQRELEELPHAPPDIRGRAKRVLQKVYGGDQEYFKARSPWTLAEQNAAVVRGKLLLRQVIGDGDSTLSFNRDFDAHLTRLGIPHTLAVLPNIGHKPMALIDALGESNWEFYRTCLRFKNP